MDVKIGKKEYNLTKISLYISDMYMDYVRAANKPLTVDGEFEIIRLNAEVAREEAETKIDKMKASLKMMTEAKRLRIEAQEDAPLCRDIRNKIIEEIVLLNGYEYDKEAWLRAIDETFFSDLIDELMGHKKKAEVSST